MVRYSSVPTSALILALLTACGSDVSLTSLGTQAPIFQEDSPEAQALAQQLSLDLLTRSDDPLGVAHVDAFEVSDVHIDALGMAHTRVQQLVGDVPVFGAQAVVHLSPYGELSHFTDGMLDQVAVNTAPSWQADEAADLALATLGSRPQVTAAPQAELVVLPMDQGAALSWKVSLEQLDGTDATAMPVVFIDAHTGDTLWQYNNLHTGTGTTHHYGEVPLNTTEARGDFYLEDRERNIGTFTYRGGTRDLYYVTDSDDRWTDSDDRSAVSGHHAAALTFDFYKSAFGRDGIDGRGGPGAVGSLSGGDSLISVLVDYGDSYNNAFWAGDYLALGTGDGRTFSALTSIDVVGHEMTHGVNERTAGFIYQGESGALDESFADVFGALVERSVFGDGRDTWWIGEAIYTPGRSGDAMRYMDDPSADGQSPDHYDNAYRGSQDNGGVHINSGIANLAFYLAANGGSHPRRGGFMEGMGADAAAQIWYRALTNYLTARSDFFDARDAMVMSAEQLYGEFSPEWAATQNAWAMVGVGEPAPELVPEVASCEGYGHMEQGRFDSSGDSVVLPNGDYFRADRGDHRGCLVGTPGTRLGLHLYKWSGSAWSKVASADGSENELSVEYSGGSGYYAWLAESVEGAGDYEFGADLP